MCKCCETIEFWKESEKDKNSRLFAKIAVYTWRKGEKRIKGNQYFDYTTRAYDLKHCPSCRTKNWTKSDEREVKKMCKYCEKEKKLEEVENDNIYFEIWGKHLQVTGKVLGIPLGRDIIIEYCPMCRKEVRRVRAKYIKTMDFLFEKVNILNCKSSSELAEKIKENEVIKIDNYGSIEYINSSYIMFYVLEEEICMKNRINADLCNENYTNCKDCIKQYFERKATNNG